MIELNIKKEIGKRIHEARKAKGLTLKELGERAGDFKQTRLTNWEQGVRAPGPMEIKQLAEALEVSPAYLMCLSDEMQGKALKGSSQLIPLLDYKQACDPKLYAGTNTTLISVSTALLPNLSTEAFALRMADESMLPEFRVGDVLIVDSTVLPKPGDFVVVRLEGKAEVIVCQYRKLSFTKPEFELLTLNDKWPDVLIKNNNGKVIGITIQIIRNFLS